MVTRKTLINDFTNFFRACMHGENFFPLLLYGTVEQCTVQYLPPGGGGGTVTSPGWGGGYSTFPRVGGGGPVPSPGGGGGGVGGGTFHRAGGAASRCYLQQP